jgi:Tol biopolymer transport system component
MKPRCGALLLGAVLVGFSTPAHAQYFGQNKVQYETFRFEILKTDHFDIYFYPQEREAAERAGQLAERWYQRERQLFNHDLRGRQPLLLYANHPDFTQTNAISGTLGEGTGGVTEPLRRRIVLPLAGSIAETDHVIGHELVHAFQFDVSSSAPAGHGGLPAALRLPLWFIEGMAEFVSLGPDDPNTALWMRDAVLKGDVPSIRQLDNPKYFPYRFGQAFWAYVTGRFGDQIIGRLMNAAARAGNWQGAIESTLGIPVDTLSAEWKEALTLAYGSASQHADSAAAFGQPLLSLTRGGGRINLSPVLSPDGSKVAFLSERGQFSIELYVADVASGALRRLTESVLDPHLQSIEFIESAGSWNADGRRFIYSGVSKGHAVLEIVDASSGDQLREIDLPTIGEAFNPSWAPDGRQIAFSGSIDGQSDLFIYDLESGTLRRVTHDLFAELQPTWSPDGQTIALVSDRFTLDSTLLQGSGYRLALLDVASGQLRPVSTFDRGKQINPQWSPDGQVLYFIADPDGVSNVYRVSLSNHAVSRLTNVRTGVSGITALSPALSVASQQGSLAFSVYESSNYDVYLSESARLLVSQPAPTPTNTDAGKLPPVERQDSILISLLADPVTGLVAQDSFAVTPYRPTLGLEYVAPPTLVAGADAFGTFVGGGTSLYFSDMLGDHNLAAGIQFQGSLKDFAGLLGYSNQKRRLNWGAVVSQVPYVTGAYAQGIDVVQGQDAVVEQILTFRQINRDVTGFLAYPFNTSQRIEFSAGVRNIDFSQQLQTRATALQTGETLQNDKTDLTAPASINLAEASGAVVFDNSLGGATGPILGHRYRFEMDGSVGSLRFWTPLIDYRQYFMPVRRFTLAARVVHYGRYGPDGEDARLSPLFLGYSTLIRGYNTSSFTAAECGFQADGTCPAFDQLIGTRILVANAELRFPLFGVLGIGSGYYGILPVDAVSFFDAGVAWQSDVASTTTDERAFFLGGDRKPVKSVGFGLRMNLLGFAIGELDLVNPLDRPDKGWYLQFSLTPGF